MRGIVLGCFMVFIFYQQVHGQNTSSSPYSVYGIGLMNTRSSAFNRSMGGAGIALQDPFNLNHLNPASYGSIVSPVSHIYEAGFFLESNQYETTSRRESNTGSGLTNLNYWFKFAPRWAATVGLAPYSSVSYDIRTEKETGAATTALYNYEGSGNITQLYLGNSIRLFKNLSLGVNASYLFGSLYKNESIQSGGSSETLTLQNKIFTNTFDLDFGLQYPLKLKNRTLVFGVIADDGLTLKGKEKFTLFDRYADTLSHSTGNTITYKLPRSVGFGLSLQSKRSTLVADLKYKKWTEARFGKEAHAFRDTWTYAAGYYYKGNEEADSFIGLISVRFGFYVQNYHLALKGNTLPNWGLSSGISIPVFDNKSSINLTYQFDRLGTTADALILQTSHKIMLDVVIRDLWGIRRKFD